MTGVCIMGGFYLGWEVRKGFFEEIILSKIRER